MRLRSRPLPATLYLFTTSAAGAPRTYRVRQGDTLFSIARQFSTTVAQLKQLNGLSGDAIKVGAQLKVPR